MTEQAERALNARRAQGFTASGLPVRLQIAGRHRDGLGILQMARAFERVTQFGG